MRIEPRQILAGAAVAGLAGSVLFLPAIVFVGSVFITPIAPATSHVSPVVAGALWGRDTGGPPAALQPINTFTVGRAISCHAAAEWFSAPESKQGQHDDCARLTPGVGIVGYLSSVHLRNEGVWQDPRVPFAQIATMTKISETWTREQLLDTVAARAEFPNGVVGVEAAARIYFGRASADLNVAQAALLVALMGGRSIDPWCDPAAAASRRLKILINMRRNSTIDEAAFDAANHAELGLTNPPPHHKPCKV